MTSSSLNPVVPCDLLVVHCLVQRNCFCFVTTLDLLVCTQAPRVWFCPLSVAYVMLCPAAPVCARLETHMLALGYTCLVQTHSWEEEKTWWWFRFNLNLPTFVLCLSICFLDQPVPPWQQQQQQGPPPPGTGGYMGMPPMGPPPGAYQQGMAPPGVNPPPPGVQPPWVRKTHLLLL